MAGRRLTKQQSRRIKQNIDTRRKQSRPHLDSPPGAEQNGIIIAHHGKQLIVEDDRGGRIRCASRQHIGQPVCGDRVIWHPSGEQEGVVTAIHERASLLVRPGFGNRIKPVAANITLICIVIAPEPEPQEALIDRYLVAAEYLAIRPVIVCNKSDLLDVDEMQAWKSRFAMYERIGYEQLCTSTRHAHGLDQLHNLLQANCSILVGQSGVGKSSLINCLIPDRQARVMELSSQITKGQHTTSHSELYHLPGNNGDIIDSPGVRDFRLGHLDRQSIEQGYIEFRPYLGRCRFSDCKHLNEPDCALLDAVDSGDIDRRRFESFQSIVTAD